MLNVTDNTRKILMAVSVRMDLGDYRDIVSGKKSRHIVKPRHLAIFMLRKTGLSYPAIGREINKNHATCILACRAVETTPELMEIAKELIGTPENENPIFSLIEPKVGQYLDNGKWRKVFKHYKAVCQVCGWEDIVEVHHKIPIKNGGNNEPENIFILCPIHHRMLHMGLLNIRKVDPPELLKIPKK